MSITTRERIFQIADELDTQGHNPTLAAVRKALGGGSFTTISEAMTDWKTKKAAREKPAATPAPQAITDRLVEFGQELWALGLHVANGRLTAEREALNALKAQLDTEKAEAAELTDQLAAELDAAKGRVVALEVSELEAHNDAKGLRAQIEGLVERAATAEVRVVEMEKRADDLNAELARVNQQNGELVKALAGTAAGKKTSVRI